VRRATDDHCEGLSREVSKEYSDAYFYRALLAAQPAEGSAQVATDPANQYRKRPVVIDAIQWPGTKFDQTPPDWFRDAMYAKPGTPGVLMRFDNDIIISTLEGEMRAQPGDWIIRGIKGEIYPCKPDIFAATYEPAGIAAEGATQAGLGIKHINWARDYALEEAALVCDSLGGDIDMDNVDEVKLCANSLAHEIRKLKQIDGDKQGAQGGGK
jgi:hypothetical protein